MKIKIQRIDKSLPLPRYETSGAVGFDLICRENMTVKPREIARIPANIIVATPPGYMLMIVVRSSTPSKKGLILINGAGIIDQDYCGPDDEIKIQVYNFTDKAVAVERGERIAQGIFVAVGRAEWQEVGAKDFSPIPSRGGFGTTG
ncbi:dUTP diphosphatase [bacterium (Candidatus Torokbacteria) CG09_land_8_20_14_0_10_42_11]|nr:MAG: dUTP diphosphatase [bacterium (Candidatus Torokbacteria) CG09_land_8_20_14_0_10_42_11]